MRITLRLGRNWLAAAHTNMPFLIEYDSRSHPRGRHIYASIPSCLRRALCTLAVIVLVALPARAQTWGEWRVLGPIEHEPGSSDIATAYPVERQLRAMEAGKAGPDLERGYASKGAKAARWTALLGAAATSTDLDVGLIDFRKAIAPLPDVKGGWNANAVAYLYRKVVVDRSMSLPLSLGSDDGVRVWFNGALLLDRNVARGVTVGDDQLTLELQEGANHLFVKVSQGGGAWGFRLSTRTRISQKAIDEAIDKGVARLLDTQLIDGSWGTRREYGGGHAAFTAYTLLKCGLPPAHPAVRRALAFAASHPAPHTYTVSCEILALATQHLPANAEKLAERVADLISWQEGSGLYAYPVHPNGSTLDDDLSCTLYAALALRAAESVGIEVPARVYASLAKGTLDCQTRTRSLAGLQGETVSASGFSYRRNGEATASMTTAGLSVLAICSERLGTKLGKGLRNKMEKAELESLAWLDAKMKWSGNAGHSAHHYFFIYGVERVGALLGLRIIGGVDWYWEGAKYLVTKQNSDGAWAAQDPGVDTLLALLFLKRATLPQSGRKQAALLDRYKTDTVDAEVILHATGDTPQTVWIGKFPQDVIERLEWAGEQGQGLHIANVEYFSRSAGEGTEWIPIGVSRGDGMSPSGQERFAIQHRFARNGMWLLKAHVHALQPPPEEGISPEEIVLEAPELSVRIDQDLDEILLDYAGDDLLNLDAPMTATASSVHGKQAAGQAVDGNFSTRWQCAVDDALPTLTVELKRPAKIRSVVLTHAWARSTHLDAPRPENIELVFSKKLTVTVTMDPNALHKTVVELPRAIRVKRFEVRVISSLGRVLGTDAVGFSEIEVR